MRHQEAELSTPSIIAIAWLFAAFGLAIYGIAWSATTSADAAKFRHQDRPNLSRFVG